MCWLYIANLTVASGNRGFMSATDVIYAAEAKSAPAFPLEISVFKRILIDSRNKWKEGSFKNFEEM